MDFNDLAQPYQQLLQVHEGRICENQRTYAGGDDSTHSRRHGHGGTGLLAKPAVEGGPSGLASGAVPSMCVLELMRFYSYPALAPPWRPHMYTENSYLSLLLGLRCQSPWCQHYWSLVSASTPGRALPSACPPLQSCPPAHPSTISSQAFAAGRLGGHGIGLYHVSELAGFLGGSVGHQARRQPPSQTSL